MNRRRMLASLLSFPLCALAPAAEPELPEEQIRVSHENGLYVGRFSLLVPVPREIVWEALTDFDHMAEVVPNLEASRVVARDKEILVVAQRGRLDFGPLAVRFESERRIELRRDEGILLSRAVSGTARHMESEMRLVPEPGGTRLDYRLEMIPNRWLPPPLGIGLLRREMAAQFTALAREMVRRQQRRAAPL